MATLAQQRANPALRSKLPLAQLSKAQQAARKYNTKKAAADSNPLYNPATQLSGINLQNAASSEADAQLNPQIAAVDAQSKSTTAQAGALSTRAADYYHQIAQQEATALARQTALGSMAGGQIADAQTAARGDVSQLGQDEAARQSADAASRGGGLGGDTGTVGRTLAGVSANQDILFPAQAATAAGQQSSWESLNNAMATTTGMRGGEVQGELAAGAQTALGKLASQKTALESTRGDLTTKALDTLRQQSYANLITQEGLGIKQKTLDADTATAAAKLKADEKDKSLARGVTKRGQDKTAATAAARLSATKEAKKVTDDKAALKKLADTRTKAKTAWGNVDNAITLLGTLNGTTMPVTDAQGNQTGTRPATTEEVDQTLLTKQKVPAWALQAAREISEGGSITPATVDLIHRSAPDVRIPRQYLHYATSMTAAGPGR